MGSKEVKDRSYGGMRRWSDREYTLLAARWCNTTQPLEGTRVGIFSSVFPGNGTNVVQRGAGMEDVDECEGRNEDERVIHSLIVFARTMQARAYLRHRRSKMKSKYHCPS